MSEDNGRKLVVWKKWVLLAIFIAFIVGIVIVVLWLSRGEFVLSRSVVYFVGLVVVGYVVWRLLRSRQGLRDYHEILLRVVNKHYVETGERLDHSTAEIEESPAMSGRFIIDFGKGKIVRYDAVNDCFFARRSGTLSRLVRRDEASSFLREGLKADNEKKELVKKLEEGGFHVEEQ